MPNRVRILFYPFFVHEVDLQDQMARACWYFSCLDPDKILFVDRTPEPFLFSLHSDFDPKVATHHEKLKNCIELRNDLEPSSLNDFDLVVRWRDGYHPSDEWREAIENTKVRSINVDRHKVRHEGGNYLSATERLYQNSQVAIDESRRRFSTWLDELPNRDRCIVMGSGPSVSSYREVDLSGATSIICNSIIKDESLLEHVRPTFLVFADPIFHFGPSLYAAEFRNLLRLRVEKFDLKIVIPFKYYPLFVFVLPELASRVVGVPLKVQRDVNHRLDLDFELKPTANVLTFLMLPLATTIAKEIGIIGCDGRPKEEDTYFWTHNRSTQINDQMQNVRRVHPAFFDIDYQDYYKTHLATLENWLRAGEKLGRHYRSLSFSHIPSLIERSPLRLPEDIDQERDLWVSINPDLINEYGHHIHFDSRVSEALGDGIGFSTLANQRLDEDLYEHRYPLFEDRSWFAVGEAELCRRYGTQLREAAKSLCEQKRGSCVFYQYMGSIDHLTRMMEVAAWIRDPKTTFIINLFFAHLDLFGRENIDVDVFEKYDHILNEAMAFASELGVIVCVDTEKVRDKIKQLFSVELDLWPFFPVTNLEGAPPRRRLGDKIIVACPAAPIEERGYDFLPAVVGALEQMGCLGRFELLVRDASMNRGMKPIAERVGAYPSVTMFEGILSSENYANLVHSADIVLTLSRLRQFRARTSGTAADAIGAKKPLVAAKETWMGDLVERFGNGETFADGDPRSAAEALCRVADDLEAYQRLACTAHEVWSSENNPRKFVTALSSMVASQPRTKEMTREDCLRRVRMLHRFCDEVEYRRRFHGDRIAAEKKLEASVKREAELRKAAWNRTGNFLKSQLRRVPGLERRIRRVGGRLVDAGGLNRRRVKQVGDSLKKRLIPKPHVSINEVECLHELLSIVCPSGLMIDVGAHRGGSLERFFENGWTVHAFEPDEENREALEAKFTQRSGSLVIDPRAVSSETKFGVAFHRSPVSTGISSLSSFHESHVESAKVDTVTLADYISDHRIDHVDFLKSDAEGWDLYVLRGFPWQLMKPRAVICEFEDRKTLPLGYDVHVPAMLLEEQGYVVIVSEWYPIVEYGQTHRWKAFRKYPVRIHRKAWGNLIGVQLEDLPMFEATINDLGYVLEE